MFTGLIEGQGRVLSFESLGLGRRMVFFAPNFSFSLGESVSVNGVCSTVLDLKENTFSVDYLKETLDKTTIGYLKGGDSVNLEQSVTPSTRLGGHVVTGHVDTRGQVLSLKAEGPFHEVTIEYPLAFAPFLIEKGSIALDGISLTVVNLTQTSFTVHIIPHTFSETIISTYSVGREVNLEFDPMGKYLHRFMTVLPAGLKKE